MYSLRHVMEVHILKIHIEKNLTSHMTMSSLIYFICSIFNARYRVSTLSKEAM